MPIDGYIRFECEWTPSALPEDYNAGTLLSMRNEVFNLGLIGYDNQEEVGFGNASVRYGENEFIISGTQTGHIKILKAEHLSWIKTIDINENKLTAGGPFKPSSESLTHGWLYNVIPTCGAVIHVHSERLWLNFINKLPTTSETAEYGTPEMAKEIERLYVMEGLRESKAMVMGGHKDGLLFYGSDTLEAIEVLKRHL